MATTSEAAPGHCTNQCWKPETRYNTNVLVGNWLEERQNWHNYRYPIASNYQTDFRDFSSQRPDKMLRLKEKVRLEMGASDVLMKNNAVGTKMEKCKYPYMVTWYDEDYNRKQRPDDEKLPPLRHWDLQHIAWLPEKSDHPISRQPTNWGLTEERNRRWNSELTTEGKGPDFGTTYRTSYRDTDVLSAAESRRYAVPRELSVHFVPHNRSKLMLRGDRNHPRLQLPEPPLCNIAEQIRATHCRIQEQGRHLQDQVNNPPPQEPLFAVKPCQPCTPKPCT